uniref:Multicilin n=1 Tax=Cynoglossus semilaevis TaxID=244447 RepID=A0A3P8VCL3_CYNSE
MKTRHAETQTGRKFTISARTSNHVRSLLHSGTMDVSRDQHTLGDICASQMKPCGRTATVKHKDKVLVPRSSSPVTVYVELPCVIEQAFSTISWDDLEECTSAVRRGCDSLSHQVTELDTDEQDFGDYALDFTADSPATLESSLSPAELVPFQGCVIPPLTPQPDFCPELNSFNPPAQNRDVWVDAAQCQSRALGQSLEFNNHLHETLHRQQEEISSLQERNLYLGQLATRAKHLASVLEKLMTVRDPNENEPVLTPGVKLSLSPCKRQRLDEGYETEASDSVEDILRDISTRCNAVLHGTITETAVAQDAPETQIRTFGAFSGLQVNIPTNNSVAPDGLQAKDCISSFRTSIREHRTIRTQVLPHGRAFTSRTQDDGYCFRWVPNHS